MTIPKPEVMQKIERDEDDKLDVLITGAGLGGLGIAISCLLSGHSVHILESTPNISEVGAGIQCLPNSTRILISWGLESLLSKHATRPRRCSMLGWNGNLVSDMDFWEYEKKLGAPFWDFHRGDLQAVLLERAMELGAVIETGARVVDVELPDGEDGNERATAILADKRRRSADLIVGADGIHSRCRDILLGREDPPVLTGDLAYRLLLRTEDMMGDDSLRGLVEGEEEVRYWMGPDMHAVNYVLRGGKLFNMVLLVPDDMPAGASTLAGNVEEMRSLFQDWDPRIPKLLALCKSVYKWRLCIRPGLDPTWSHESGTFTILGDAAHATLPYLASGAGMSLEDGQVLGLCLGKIGKRDGKRGRKMALEVYERCRRERTKRVVQRGNVQQRLYHVPDGEEQRERDRLLRAFGESNGKGKVSGAEFEERDLLDESDPLPWRWGGVGKWLLTYDCAEDVQRRWAEVHAKRLREGKIDRRTGGECEAVRAVL